MAKNYIVYMYSKYRRDGEKKAHERWTPTSKQLVRYECEKKRTRIESAMVHPTKRTTKTHQQQLQKLDKKQKKRTKINGNESNEWREKGRERPHRKYSIIN